MIPSTRLAVTAEKPLQASACRQMLIPNSEEPVLQQQQQGLKSAVLHQNE
jgi:hypothetical protein